MVPLEKLVWGEVAEGLVWANGITDVFPLTQRVVEFFEVETAVRRFIELSVWVLCARSTWPFSLGEWGSAINGRRILSWRQVGNARSSYGPTFNERNYHETTCVALDHRLFERGR